MGITDFVENYKYILIVFVFFAILLIICLGSILYIGGFFKQSPEPPLTASVAPKPVYHSLDAAFVNNTIPVNMTPAKKYDVSITVYNSGDTPWSNATHTMMIPVNTAANDALSFNNTTFSLPSGITVKNGTNYTWKISMTAPKWGGNYTLMYQMADANKTPFGGTFVKNIVVGDVNSTTKFVTQQILYYPSMSKSLNMKNDSWQNVSISVNNSGRYNWTELEHYRLAAVDYEKNDATKFYAATEFHFAPDDVVMPGETAMWKFKLFAPPGSAGTYYLKYRMQKDNQWFGSTLNVTLTVR